MTGRGFLYTYARCTYGYGTGRVRGGQLLVSTGIYRVCTKSPAVADAATLSCEKVGSTTKHTVPRATTTQSALFFFFFFF